MNKGKSILLVDDDKDLVEVLQLLLEQDGYHVLTAYSGNEALEVLKKNIDQVRIVFSDVRMPDGDGISLLKNIRKLDPKLPYVLLHTGFSEVSVKEAKELGAVDLIKKPAVYKIIDDYFKSLLEKNE